MHVVLIDVVALIEAGEQVVEQGHLPIRLVDVEDVPVHGEGSERRIEGKIRVLHRHSDEGHGRVVDVGGDQPAEVGRGVAEPMEAEDDGPWSAVVGAGGEVQEEAAAVSAGLESLVEAGL